MSKLLTFLLWASQCLVVLLAGCRSAPPDSSPITSTTSGWSLVSKLALPSGEIWIGDAQLAPQRQHGLVQSLPEGSYEVLIQKRAFSNGDVRVSRLRVVRPGFVPKLSAVVGTSFADSGSQGVCDWVRYSAAMPKSEDDYWALAEKSLTALAPNGAVFNLDAAHDAVLVHCESGWGDGVFQVFELTEARTGKRCGLEVVFIRDDETYFG